MQLQTDENDFSCRKVAKEGRSRRLTVHFSLLLAVKFPGTQSFNPSMRGGSQQDSAVISAASSSASNGLECPPALQEQPQAVIPQGTNFEQSRFVAHLGNFWPRHQQILVKKLQLP